MSLAKFAAGTAYGPVLSQTDLYLLNTELEINPILIGNSAAHLVFDVVSGNARGFNQETPNFPARDEPATLPRVSQVIIITEHSPWCTIVKNEKGVTVGDICATVWKEYTENMVTDAEFSTLQPRIQEQVRRMAMVNSQGGNWGAMYYSPPQAAPNRFRRVDWLRERIYFDTLKRDDGYAKSRLGFKAPNIFIMNLVA